ncbi:putative MAGNESIUM CHELATASE domain protein [Mycobacterium xenopi 4042]|uniref:Putative MAGNESIUM CHELATASE domain protein n=1 Tax=Mycobacterium xenopi 4042 TaxID=1299334 RepID=X8AGC4_MYCXE|nr:putative MAGNESIUM CHELATASE domain protein [Mycobacterium xenopi 4042]
MVTLPTDLPRTVGQLRAAGHRERGVKQEIRENLLARLAEGADGEAIWPASWASTRPCCPSSNGR